MAKKSSSEDQTITDGKIYAILSYLSIFCIIPLLFKKDNTFALHHGRQGLVIFVAQVALFVAHIVFPWILKLGLFALGVLSLYGIISVLRGMYTKLPLIYDVAEKITL